MDLTDIARSVFSDDRFATEATGIVIDHLDSHTAQCSLSLDGRHRNARGVAMGGVLFTLADFATAVAANSDCLSDGGDLHWVSLLIPMSIFLPPRQATV